MGYVPRDDEESQFTLFWNASEYDRFNIREFSAVQERFASIDKPLPILEYPAMLEPLPVPKTDMNKYAARRTSKRQFEGGELSGKEIGTVTSSFYAFNGLEHRSYPSAGAAYALEIFCVLNRCKGFEPSIAYYNPDKHALSVLGPAPSWRDQQRNLNLLVEGIPQLIILFVLFSDRLTAKYPERGGRFALIEVGAAAQQLALQLAESRKLSGVAIGGLIDRYWLDVLGLQGDRVQLALGYAVGK